MSANKKSRYLEMRYLQRSGCYIVAVRDDAPVSLVQFPEDGQIISLWSGTTGASIDYLRKSPERPYGKFFLIAPEESTHPRDRLYFLRQLDAMCTFVTSTFSVKDLEVVTRHLSQSPLYLVSYEKNGVRQEEYMNADQASWALDPDHTTRILLGKVIELQGHRLVQRDITIEERKKIANMAWGNG